MKNLYKLTKVKYQEGADASLFNAKAHLKVASLSATNDCIGIGTGHLIIACEELCKASILRIKALYPDLAIKDLREYFHSHDTKHEKILEIFIAVSQVSKEFESSTHSGSSTDTKMSGKEILLIGLLIVIVIGAIYLFTKQMQVSDVRSLEKLRQRGFYVDLTDDKRWLLPEQVITKEQFNAAASIVRKMFDSIEKHLFEKRPNKSELDALAKELGYLKTEPEKLNESGMV